MSRQIRIIYPGAVYHTGARGYERSYIFDSDLDKKYLLDIFGSACKKYNVVIHAYVIMSNHYHILMETIEPKLTKIMHFINMSYGKYYNTRHQRKGYVFEDRYSAFVIQKGEPMKWQVQYIHMNPLRAKMEKTLGLYKWTSHNKYVGKDEKSPADCDYVLSLFGQDTKEAIPAYEAYMGQAKILNKVKAEIGMYGSGIIGDESFIKHIRLSIDNKKLPEEISNRREIRKTYSAHEIISAVSRYYGISDTVLCSKRGRWNVYKKVLIYLLVNDGGLGGADIGRLIGMHQSSISKAVKRIEDKMTKNKLLCEEIKKIRVIYNILNKVLI